MEFLALALPEGQSLQEHPVPGPMFTFCFIDIELYFCHVQLEDSCRVPYDFFQTVCRRNHMKTQNTGCFSEGSISVMQIAYYPFITSYSLRGK